MSHLLAFLLELLRQYLRIKPRSGALPGPEDDAIPTPPDERPVTSAITTPLPAPSTLVVTIPPPGVAVEVLAPRATGPWSPIARRVTGARNPRDAKPRTPWGLLLHTTGGGVTAKAKRTGRSPVSIAIEVYLSSQNGSGGYLWGGPHYVLDHDGVLYQIAPDDVITHHAGGPDRAHYVSGAWTKRCSAAAVEQWRLAWPEHTSPATLYPSRSPNSDFIGVEMIPVGDGYGVAAGPGLRFTQAQLDTVDKLARDCAERHQWPAGWYETSRLLGHEDVQPIRRHDRKGTWDPGYLRAAPYFSFPAVRARLRTPPADPRD